MEVSTVVFIVLCQLGAGETAAISRECDLSAQERLARVPTTPAPSHAAQRRRLQEVDVAVIGADRRMVVPATPAAEACITRKLKLAGSQTVTLVLCTAQQAEKGEYMLRVFSKEWHELGPER